MSSNNQVITLFNNQDDNGVSSAVLLSPESKNVAREYHIFLRGDLGEGNFSLSISFDGTNYAPWLTSGSTSFTQSTLGFSDIIKVTVPVYVKANLVSATSPDLTAELFYRYTL